MPCRVETESDKENEVAFLSQALCAVLTRIEKTDWKHFLDDLDYKEAGIRKERLVTWWQDHKRQDAINKERERREAVRQAYIERAKSKLDKEELKALGLL